VTHTKDIGQILQAIHTTRDKIGGAADITTALSVAQLALKHRQNKNLRQRIVLFVGSPLAGPAADDKGMVRLAKKLKKNNVAVDVVAFGDGVEDGERSVLRQFVENASSGDNCHLVSVPPGPHLLSDMIISSPILAGDRGLPEEVMADVASGAGAGTGSFEFGVDPSLDPELAMALRMSMEEEQARQAAAAQASSTSASSSTAVPAGATASVSASASAPAPPTSAPAQPTDDEEAALLQQALAMSEGRDVEMAEHAPGAGEDEEMSEEEAIARAIEMSMQGEGQGQEGAKK